MSRKEKMGGRHASVGCDRHIADAAQATAGEPPLPCFAVLEGGYAREFAQCVEAFVNGWERR